MHVRTVVIGLAVTGALASSCASTARDAVVDIYNESVEASSFDESCRIDANTFETATQAYTAQFGQQPSAESDLVPALLRESPAAWQFDPTASTSYVPTPGGSCDGFEIEQSNSSSIGQSAVDVINQGGDAGCVTDKRQIETALDAHFAVNGFDATTIEELDGFGVEDEINRWTLELPADATSTVPVVVPVVGGPCDG